MSIFYSKQSYAYLSAISCYQGSALVVPCVGKRSSFTFSSKESRASDHWTFLPISSHNMPPKFVPRERKHKRLEKLKPVSNGTTTQDANADIVLPSTAAEREERRRKLQEELRAQQPQSKVSGKKRKRLDHYIDTKLRKEENQELIKKLANQHVDTSLFQSSKKLGRISESKREGLERALKERAKGIDVRGDHDEILFEKRKIVAPPEPESDSEDDEDDGGAEVKVADIAKPVEAVESNSVGSSGIFGGGLKRPLEIGEDGRPVIKKRKRVKRARDIIPRTKFAAQDEDEDMDKASASEPEMSNSDSEESDFRGFDSEPEEVDGEPSSDEDSSEGGSEEDEEESIEDEEDEEEAEVQRAAKKEKSSAFKLWATEQRHDALGFQPSTAPIDDAVIRAAFKPRAPSPDPIAQALASVPVNVAARPKSAITIPRSEEIQKVRLELPVVQEEQRIMEAIHNNPVIVVCGATGSGKTTQVPQMMYESGYGALIGNKTTSEDDRKPSLGRGMIGITQPRRVAAVSVADRVATEMGDEFKYRVAHQVRYDTTVSRDTAMKFMTDGILLREIDQDFILSKYSAIVIDEAHERSVNTDILIGMLSRIVNLRDVMSKETPDKYYPLKLVIMSATLRVSDFMQNQRLFKNGAPPIVEAEGRQYPVTVHFSRKTQRDYVEETVNKVARGHRKLPHGSILVFLTGQNEIEAVAKRLKDTLGANTAGYGKMLKARESADQMPLELDDMEEITNRRSNNTLEGEDSDDSDTEFQGVDDDADDAEFEVEGDAGLRGALKPHILPLYASLPTIQQMRVFQPPPDGSRMIVLATNVAETSLTIPGVRYVFDCGRSKEKKYDTATGVQTFEIDWISKASASQRSGRAGRTGPGHCYRLYSSAVFENYFAEHGIPEILRTPLESTVLQLKAMDIHHVVNFPFPTPPDRSQLATAEKLLSNLGAIEAKFPGRITEIGRELIKHPVSPRFGKMLLLALRNNLVAPTIATVAALAVGDLMIPQVTGPKDKESPDSDAEYDSDPESRANTRLEASAALTASQQRQQAYGRAQATLSRWDDLSDSIKMLTAVAAHADAASKHTATNFCTDFFLREKGMQEVQQLRAQLHNIVRSTQRSAVQNKSLAWKPTVDLPSERERKQLNQIVASGFIDQIAIRSDLLPNASPSMLRKPRRAIDVAYTTLFPSVDAVDHKATPEQQEMQRSVFVHAASVLARRSVTEMPSYIVYSHLSRAASSSIVDTAEAKMPRTRMHPLTALSAKEVAALAEGTPLLEVGKPTGKVEEAEGGKKRVCWVFVGIKGPATSTVSWPMGAWKVRQKKEKGGEWVVEEVLQR
jgi:ATP-dependent RNA helicase DHX37/DHR1